MGEKRSKFNFFDTGAEQKKIIYTLYIRICDINNGKVIVHSVGASIPEIWLNLLSVSLVFFIIIIIVLLCSWVLIQLFLFTLSVGKLNQIQVEKSSRSN